MSLLDCGPNLTRPVKMKQSSLLRDAVGGTVGGLAAAIAGAAVFLAFVPLPAEPSPGNHTGEALRMLSLVLFSCGGSIGWSGFSADAWSDLYPSVIGSDVVIGLLCRVASLDLRQTATMPGSASAGLAASAVGSLLLARWFPPKTSTYEV
jgi:hypothetical protein